MTTEPQPKGDALHALIYYLRGNDECLTDGLNNMRYVIAGQIEAALPSHDAQVREEYEEMIPHDSECQIGQWNSSLQMTMDCTCGKIERVARLKPPIGGKA